jgi:hypothetical protein
MATQAIGPLYSAPLLGGDDGTAQTVSLLRSLIDDAWKDSFINRTAIDIIRGAGVAQYDEASQVRAIYNWVRGNLYFVNDPVSKEALRPTRDLLQLGAGDCDDFVNVMAALVGSIGIPVQVVTIAADPNFPTEFSHIYAEAYLDGAWVPLDAARPGAQYGMAPQVSYRPRRHWSLTDDSYYDEENAPTFSGVGRGLGRYHELGQDGGIDWNQILQTGLQQTAPIIRAAAGGPTLPAAYAGAPSGYVAAPSSAGISTGAIIAILLAIGAVWYMSQ